MITWVIGRGGLLGSAVSRRTPRQYLPGPIPWSDVEAARRVLHEQARGLEAAASGDAWRIVWAAGAATTSTPPEEAMAEVEPLRGLVTGLRSALPSGPGAFFLASSAGGVYAGASPPPFGAETGPAPLSAYGELKLAQEDLAIDVLAGVIPVVVGRLSNLYGPGQNLDKLQGLISRLALSAATQQPINIFVPLETIRDYLYVDDAAREVLAATEDPTAPGASVRIIASGQPATVAQLIRTMSLVAKRRVPVALGSHPSATAQSLDLRLIPTAPLRAITPLAAGMKNVYFDILSRLQQDALVG
ncbi:MAG: NAD-dependent epimerase/dehydratase family protein [Actinomycetales bacterium]|nr:NAD-dependent epimerase/dehydratase family protein [Actinomycetales bacterium]